MGTKRRTKSDEKTDPVPAARRVFDSPFKDLKRLLKAPPAAVPPSRRPPPPTLIAKPPPPPAIDDATLFRQALEGVRPLGANGGRVAVQPRFSRNVISEEAEVLAQLSDLVSGQAPFELTETEEYVEGARVGLDPRVVTRLRRGEFSTQGHLDLHGLTQIDAKEALARFILESVRKGLRAVAVVHGRGLRSPGGQPVLKHAVAEWLSHGTIGSYVLAFTSAKAYDGGAGAVWVLLRRERKRGRFDVLQGARRRD
ncbi:MAG TPA: Smr/MutS family protein [Candidatus Binataceae bacterium]|jgi:DNA-nicking Smr family endonuclease|nr:Smr/MutS family protein [Candidatus Binataceae bacterium]